MIRKTTVLALAILGATAVQPAFAEADAAEQYINLHYPPYAKQRDWRQNESQRVYRERERESAEREAARLRELRRQATERRQRRNWDD